MKGEYLLLAPTSLKEATHKVTKEGGAGNPAYEIEEVEELFLHQLVDVRAYLPEGLGQTEWRRLSKIDREDFIADIVNVLLNAETEEFIKSAMRLEKSYQFVQHRNVAISVSEEVLLYRMIKAQLRKHIGVPSGSCPQNDTLEEQLSKLVDDSLLAKETVDIFEVAGIERPDISILDEAFLADLAKKDHEDLRLKLLRRLVEDKINVTFNKGNKKSQTLSDLLPGFPPTHN